MRRRLFWSWLLGMGLCWPWTLRAAGYPSTPQEVLEKFLALDAEAAGIAADTWQELGRYTTWPSFPGWENFVVIERYSVGKMIVGTTRAQVPVTYQSLGQLSNQFVADTQPETVLYHLNKVKGQWKVDSPELPPHVAYSVMKERLASTGAADPKIKAANETLLSQIEAARQTLRR